VRLTRGPQRTASNSNVPRRAEALPVGQAWQGGRGADAADLARPRVAAVTLAVPVAAIFSAELKRVRIPVGVECWP
jgi:hypothetical protein